MTESTITVQSGLTIDHVTDLQKRLISDQAGKALRIDLKNLGNFDVCGIQLLISLQKSARMAGGRLILVNAPPLLLESMEGMGLDTALFG